MTSYYEGLPKYLAAADLVVLLDEMVRDFSRTTSTRWARG